MATEQVEVFEADPHWKLIRPQLPKGLSKVASKKGFEINGVQFTYIKSVRSVMMLFIPFEQECQRAMKHAAANIKRLNVKSPAGVHAVYDRYDYYWDLLGFITLEDIHSQISIEELDMTECEDIITAFLPESMRLAATLIGF